MTMTLLKKQKGFTLIEVLISMALIAVGMIALVTLFPVGLRSSRLAGDFTTASFIGQQALDGIRASAQADDPADTGFTNVNGNGLGYYELPLSRTKGYLLSIEFPNQPQMSQWWDIELATATSLNVTNSIYGIQATGVGFTGVYGVYKSASDDLAFVLAPNYDGFAAGDKLRINVEMRGGAPYYWYAMRAPVTEDLDLDGILDGPGAAQAKDRAVNEDTGLDLVPDFWDINNNGVYEVKLDLIGETGFSGTNDPHGDNKFARDSSGVWTTTVINSSGKEGNNQIDAWPDDYMQKVTVTVGWREGGQDRTASFSAAIPNQFR